MVVVADSSPLTALLHLERLSLLHQLYGQIIIPATVAAEVRTLVSFGYDVSFLDDTQRYTIRTATDQAFMHALSEHLDAGEAEAITIARELRADLLLIDERLGKDAAEAIQIPCKGVVGVLIAAKQAFFL